MLVEICRSCLRQNLELVDRNDQLRFSKNVEQLIGEANKELDVQISLTSCQRFCPKDRVTLIVKNQLNMSTSIEAFQIAQNIIHLLK